jgi:hypothetical protein
LHIDNFSLCAPHNATMQEKNLAFYKLMIIWKRICQMSFLWFLIAVHFHPLKSFLTNLHGTKSDGVQMKRITLQKYRVFHYLQNPAIH